MSGIRFIIALYFLFAGLESELRADASHIYPADFPSSSQGDGVTNLISKTSLQKMTKVASEMDPWILPAPLIDLLPNLNSTTVLVDSLWQYPRFIGQDAFRSSGSSPPGLFR